MAWRKVIGGLLGGALIVTGCATKKFVQEEVAKSQERVGSDVGRVDKSLSDEKARVEGLQKELGETRAATEAASRKGSEAAAAASQAASRADEASAKATDAAARADAAGATAKEALGKATETDQRLTKLWASRDKRTLTEDAGGGILDFDKWVLTTGRRRGSSRSSSSPRSNHRSPWSSRATPTAAAPALQIQPSQWRAEAVRRFLVEKGASSPPRIHSIGLGDIRPVADKTKQGRDQNRRVSIRLYAPAE